jgi:NADH-quinone oxidoreductase subunit J
VSITTDLIPALGTALLTTYVLPFEIASILLLAALVGALIIARD